MKIEIISETDFESLGELSEYSKNLIRTANLEYKIPSQNERDNIIIKCVKYLLEESPVVAGSHRKNIWENGWKENFEEYVESNDLRALVPKYLGKFDVQRVNGKFVIPISDDFEYLFVELFQLIIFEKYFKDFSNIYEFGAGTGHNLLRLRRVNSEAMLHSLEWTKQGVGLIKYVADKIGDNKIEAHEFDFTSPNYSLNLKPSSAAYTFAALEQLSDNTDQIIEYWLKNKPSIIVNIEPITENLDQNELLQYLSTKYCEKRGYIKNYISKLKELERNGKVEIHEIIRPGIGGLFIENYSIIVWSPV
jgi:hypothetical protein